MAHSFREFRAIRRVLGVVTCWGLFAGVALAQLPPTAVDLRSEDRLTSVNGQEFEGFGRSLAVDGTTMVVGAPGAFTSGLGAGLIYIFEQTSAGWVQQAALLPPESGRWFGSAVAISGDTMVVGAVGSPIAFLGTNGAYVFRRENGTWQYEMTLDSDPPDGVTFGISVAIQGDTILVGSIAGEGGVYVFTRSGGTTWTRQTVLRSGESGPTGFGSALAFRGDTLVVGAMLGTGREDLSGTAYVFTRTAGTFTRQAKLTAPDGRGTDRFGAGVAVDGDTAIVSAFRGPGPSGSGVPGAVYVFSREDQTWTYQAKLALDDGVDQDFFGGSLAFESNALLVGAEQRDGPAGTNQGMVYLYIRRGGTWTLTQILTEALATSNDRYGTAVVLKGATAYVGSSGTIGSNTDSGIVQILVDRAPPLPDFGQLVLLEDQQMTVVFGARDPDNPQVPVDLTVTSTNAALLPAQNITFQRDTGPTVRMRGTLMANATGTSQLTVTASDGLAFTTKTLNLLVLAQNDAPAISTIADQTIVASKSTGAIPFTLTDVDHPLTSVALLASSSNTSLIPTDSIVFGGATGDAARSVTVTPTPDLTGTSTITLYAMDGSAINSRSFTVTVEPAPVQTYYLAEGATGPFFDLDILLANPHDVPAPVTLTFLPADGVPVTQTMTLAPTSRTTIRVDEIAGLESASLSTIVTSTANLPLVVERTMRWDGTGYGAHTEKATSGAATQWYFAEGAQGFFSTYFLLVNPQATPNVAHVRYLIEGEPAIDREYRIAPHARFTIDASTEPALVDRAFGALVTFDQPGAAERAMYFGTDPIWTGGHASAGATAPSTTWFLAEGATGSYFTTYVLLANPGDDDATVTLTYLPGAGGAATPVVRTVTLGARQRITRNIATEDPTLADAAVATQVESTRPIVVERAQYWPNPAWYEAHNSFGVTAPGVRWGLAEGRVGGAESSQTYILLANPGTTDAAVTLTFLRAGGSGSPIARNVTVPATSRLNVAVAGPGSDVPELANEAFATVISSTQPIAVERSMYSNSTTGVIWAAGTNATATALPVP